MYLNSVLSDIQRESAPPKQINSEHLYKLNEAIFNLPEEDLVDTKFATKLFQAVQRIRKSYNSGKVDDTDDQFAYDYRALLGTLQNQHFFSNQQTESMLVWMKEVCDDGSSALEKFTPTTSKADAKRIRQLEEDNKRLTEEVAKFKDMQAAVKTIQSFGNSGKGESEKPKAKAKSKPKGKTEIEEEEDEEPAPKAKAKAKAKEEPKAAVKAKSKSGAKKKWKAKESPEDAAEESGGADEA